MTEPEQAEAYQTADALKARIFQRTGLAPNELQCPREKSAMTPCIARDGSTAVAFTSFGVPVCVGCDVGLNSLVAKEAVKSDGR